MNGFIHPMLYKIRPAWPGMLLFTADENQRHEARAQTLSCP